MTAALLDGLAQWLDGEALGVYRRGTPYESGEVAIVLGGVIPEPGELVVLTPYAAGDEPDSRLPFDEPYIQVRRRGTGDQAVSAAGADALYEALHGLGPVTLPGGVLLLSAIAVQPPTPMGRDEAGRHSHLFNARFEYHRPTAHRPA